MPRPPLILSDAGLHARSGRTRLAISTALECKELGFGQLGHASRDLSYAVPADCSSVRRLQRAESLLKNAQGEEAILLRSNAKFTPSNCALPASRSSCGLLLLLLRHRAWPCSPAPPAGVIEAIRALPPREALKPPRAAPRGRQAALASPSRPLTARGSKVAPKIGSARADGATSFSVVLTPGWLPRPASTPSPRAAADPTVPRRHI